MRLLLRRSTFSQRAAALVVARGTSLKLCMSTSLPTTLLSFTRLSSAAGTAGHNCNRAAAIVMATPPQGASTATDCR